MRRDLIPLREVSVDNSFKHKYLLIKLAMDIITEEVGSGKPIEGNCHSMTRAVAKSFSDFIVVDGCLPRLVGSVYGESFGREVHFSIPPSHNLYRGRQEHLYHSWLVWKADHKFIIDLCPPGAVPGCSSPVSFYQDEYSAMLFHRSPLPEGVTEDFLVPLVESFHLRFTDVCKILDI